MQSWPDISCKGSRCTGGVPAGLDAISIDLYDEHNTDGPMEVESVKVFLHRHMYPKLHPHQQALLVPGIFASDPLHCIAHNVSCPLENQSKQIVSKLELYFEFAKN